MKQKHKSSAYFLILFLFCISNTHAEDCISRRTEFKNNIKFNVTGNLFFDNMYSFSYERNFFEHQTGGISLGYLCFPNIIHQDLSYVNASQTLKRNGIMSVLEYRFYLPRENCHPAPHGLFVGPYISYYAFENSHSLDINMPDGSILNNSLDFNMQAISVGAQIGYQIVIKNRVTLDFVFLAPAVSEYLAALNYGNHFENESDVSKEIIEAALSEFPLLANYLPSVNYTSLGRVSLFGAGIRFCVSVGFRF